MRILEGIADLHNSLELWRSISGRGPTRRKELSEANLRRQSQADSRARPGPSQRSCQRLSEPEQVLQFWKLLLQATPLSLGRSRQRGARTGLNLPSTRPTPLSKSRVA